MRLGYTLFWLQFAKVGFPAAKIKISENFPFEMIKKGEITMTVDEAKKIIKEKAGVEDSTINFLLCYKYGEELIVKLAKAIKGA